MRRIIVSATILLVASVSARAQEKFPSGEVFGGYSYLNSKVLDRESLHGWSFGLAGNLSPHWGFATEVSGLYGTATIAGRTINLPPFPPITVPPIDVNASKYLFLFGPRYSVRGNATRAFAHVLVGGAKTNLRASLDELTGGLDTSRVDLGDTGLAMALGGGLDLNAGKSVAVRVFQIDYLPSRRAGRWEHDFRAQFGIVFKFGN